jgi:hypothetical protein
MKIRAINTIFVYQTPKSERLVNKILSDKKYNRKDKIIKKHLKNLKFNQSKINKVNKKIFKLVVERMKYKEPKYSSLEQIKRRYKLLQKLKKLKRRCVECNKFYIPTNTQKRGKKQIYCSLNCHQNYRKKLGKIKRLPLIIKRKQALLKKKEKYISSIIKNKDKKLRPYLDKLKKLKKFKNELKSKKTKDFFEMSVHKQGFGNLNHSCNSEIK